MKKILLSITLVLLLTTTLYLIGAFIKAEPNPFLWSEHARILIVFLWSIFLCFIPPIVCIVED